MLSILPDDILALSIELMSIIAHLNDKIDRKQRVRCWKFQVKTSFHAAYGSRQFKRRGGTGRRNSRLFD